MKKTVRYYLTGILFGILFLVSSIVLQHFFLSFHASRKTDARNSFCFLQGIYLYGILTNHRAETPYIVCIRPFLEFQRSM